MGLASPANHAALLYIMLVPTKMKCATAVTFHHVPRRLDVIALSKCGGQTKAGRRKRTERPAMDYRVHFRQHGRLFVAEIAS